MNWIAQGAAEEVGCMLLLLGMLMLGLLIAVFFLGRISCSWF